MNQPQPTALPVAGRRASAWALFLSLVVIILALDLFSKYWSFAKLAEAPVVVTVENSDQPGTIPFHTPTVVIPSVLNLQLMLNTGAIFGIGKGQRVMFVVVGLIAIVVIGRLFWKSPAQARWLHIALGLILAGAIGNLYDRMRYGAVRDMLHMLPGVKLPFGWRWPIGPNGIDEIYPWIFNIADVSLVCGVILMLIILWREPQPAPANDKAAR